MILSLALPGIEKWIRDDFNVVTAVVEIVRTGAIEGV
jgi:hypothetical protein